MITLFISTSCTSCRRAKRWLEENRLPYQERDIFIQPLSESEFKHILKMSYNGTEEIISTRSRIFRNLSLRLESLSLKELYKLITHYPSLLRRPIIMDSKNLQVGYNEEAIRCFLPRSTRKLELEELLNWIDK